MTRPSDTTPLDEDERRRVVTWIAEKYGAVKAG